jgi:hypothetical protein
MDPPKPNRRRLPKLVNRSLDDFTAQSNSNRAHISPMINIAPSLTRYSRSPHKYDHMHEKTFIANFVPTTIDHEF